MNINSIFIVFCIYILSAVPSYAEQCSRLSFSSSEKNNMQYVSMIVSHNGELLERTTHKKNILNDEHSYYLEPGEHTFIIEQWPAKIYRKLQRGNKISKKYNLIDITSQSVYLKIDAGRHYQVKFLSNEQPLLKLVDVQPEDVSCTASEKGVMQAKVIKKGKNKHENIMLPATLEYRLRKLMTKLKNYHQFQEDDNQSNYFHAKLNPYMGTTIDNEYQKNGSAIKVLSVLPYSLASKLQLMSGDIITHLNSKEIRANNKTPDQQLSEYFASLYIGKAIEIDVLRNDQQKQLTGIFQPIIIPDVSYKITEEQNLNKIVQAFRQNQYVPANLQFELDQLILEIKNYYQSTNYNYSSINISRDKKLDDHIGLSGGRVKLKNGIGLKLVRVAEDSFAQSLGLQAGDTIVSINNQGLTTQNVDSSIASLRSLLVDEHISITVIRNGKSITLSERFKPQELTSFNLMIDLQAVGVISEQIAKISKLNKFRYRKKVKKNNRSQYWHGKNTFEPKSTIQQRSTKSK